MHFTSLAVAALALASGASAFAVDAFQGPGCTGSSQYVNIWDNTCGSWMRGFQSFRVVYYGGGGQNGHFCRANTCDDCIKWKMDVSDKR